MIPETTKRVANHTSAKALKRIQNQTKEHIASSLHERPGEVNRRLKALDKEWDIERALEANGSSLLLLGLALSLFRSRKWLLLPVFVGGFCLQHALQGWCPPIELFRRLGIRTSSEIEAERAALKALRGDFKSVGRKKRQKLQPGELLAAAKRP